MNELKLPPSWDGSVVLDIGGDIGALVLRVPPALDGQEIDLDPQDASSPCTHSCVRERRLVSGSWFAAVYPNLKEGLYIIEGSGQRVTVVGGQVTEVDYEIKGDRILGIDMPASRAEKDSHGDHKNESCDDRC